MAVSQSLTLTEVSYSTSNNTSQVRILWKSTQTGESWNGYGVPGKYYISINGSTESEHSISAKQLLPEMTTTLLDTTITVPHRDDGTGSISVRTWMNTDISAGIIEKSASLALTTIARASYIDSVSNQNLGSACSVKWTPKANSFRYKLKFSMGDWSYTTDVIHPNQPIQYTYTGYTLPLEAAKQIPNSKTGRMAVTLYTYKDSNATVQVGSAYTDYFTVTVPSNKETKPTLEMSLYPEGSLGDKFSGLYIQGLTKVKAILSGSAKFSATVSSYGLTVQGKDVDSSFISEYLSTTGLIEVIGKVTDSRGISNENSQKITVIPYSKPTILPASDESGIICARCDEKGNITDSGTYLKIKARRSYSKVMSGEEQKNLCSIRYRYRAEDTSKFSDWVTLLAKDDLSIDSIDSDPIENIVNNENVGFSTETSYIVQIGVIDDLGENATIQFIVPTDFVTVDIPEDKKGKVIGIFRYASDEHNDGKNHVDMDGFLHGGGVDNLTIGTMLTASSDANINLDDMKIPGCYYSPDKDTTQYISGAPSNVNFGFGLEIRQMQSENNIRQTLYYGITTWYRHWNGQEWSAWVSSLTGVSDEVTAQDFVIDSGVSGSWNYRLWQKGDAELWGRITLTYNDARSLKGAAGLPFSFASKPTVNMTLSEATAYAYRQGAIVLSEVYTVGTLTINLYMINGGGGLVSGNTADVSVTIKGRWK